ncbi:MAG: RagB/SusD family nutrient uptake outer membrane protein [Lewinellaceae bacterium]|nr:RagB/SusD family nutrient uptake outer membrane protein [Lewinellaceae bacterium]
MKNWIKKTLIYKGALVALLSMSACGEDFLNLQPFQSVTLDGAVTTLDGYRAAISGAYSSMQSSNYYGRYFVLVPDVMSDDVKQNAQANRARDFSDFVANSQDGISNGMFNTIYNTILRCNTIINADVELAPAVKAQQDQYIGEAHAIRGLAYFDLVRSFAQHYGFTADNSHPGVPIVLEFDESVKPARNTVAEVYAQIVSDLEKSVQLMTINPAKPKTMSKAAAQALLARVYLYMGNWAKAEEMATAVISSGRYSLVSNANYVSSWNAESSSESIFSIFFRADDDNGSDALGRMYILEGYGDYLPSADVINLIPAGDVRLGVFKTDPNLSGNLGTVRVNKFPNPTVQNSTPVIRLSEMYLIRAEARARQNKTSEAQADVNLIRKRGLPGAADVTATGQALLDEIEKEKRIELMFEGHRLWELMRLKKSLVRTNCTNLTCSVNYPNDRFVQPIPQREIDANPNIAQNPGY